MAPGEGAGVLGALKSYKDNGAALSELLSVVASREGGALIRGRKNPTQIMAPAPLPVIKIVKHSDVGGGGRQNPTKDYGVPFSLSLR